MEYLRVRPVSHLRRGDEEDRLEDTVGCKY